ncbi:Rv3235 family protein [Klenkia marina]|uniref:Rv3235 family protein n=1 Tax=Klenkia marina TaxID=1960309 RepID=UPI001FB44F59|nr:Rv3235 family protein [Klenkia marina]
MTQLVQRGVPALRPVLAPGPRPGAVPAGAAVRTGAPSPAGPPAPVAHRLLTMTLEAFSGLRPLAQLRAAYTLPVFTAITRGRRPAWCAAGSGPLLVGGVRVAEPVEGVAEVCAVARRNGRAHAVAARLEVIDGRWRCTALQVG